MGNTPQIFDAVATPLEKGVNLVEASAGTGKTYTIAMLVLRAVTELVLPVEEVLIVTFTKAATEELKSRVRQRLAEARDLLEGREIETDPALRAWQTQLANPELALERLRLALYDIDRSGIFTIHSFCQRMLQEQALESGQLFDVELLADINHIRTQVVDDYWRTHLYQRSALHCSIVTHSFASPETLLKSVANVTHDIERVEPQTGEVEECCRDIDRAFADLRGWWLQHGTELFNYLQAGVAEQTLKKPFRDDFRQWYHDIDMFLRGTTQVLPQGLTTLLRQELLKSLNGSKLRGDAKKQQYIGLWPDCDDVLIPFVAACDALLLAVRAGLARKIHGEVARRLAQQGSMSFDDLITRLSAALANKGGDALVQVLAQRYKMALIDEFQDTDRAQYHIFSTLFGGGNHYLYLIGDPKQAIYKFRGADIYSYFTAREAAQSQLTLQHNYRSHPDLVAEVNDLFGGCARPFGFAEDVLAYSPVEAAKTADDGALLQNNTPLAVMAYWQLPPSVEKTNGQWSSGRAADVFMAATVGEIVQLLDGAGPTQLVEQGVSRSVQPSDIAILVRSNQQAESYLDALARVGVPAVVASKQSVFESRECGELFQLLQALAAPGDMASLKAAMTVSWFGLSGDLLDALWQDEAAVDGWYTRFQRYYLLWQERGFLAMMNSLLAEEKVLVVLGSQPRAERRITNISHLLETVQEEESSQNLGCSQTLQWLQGMMENPGGVENSELRLESDEQTVKIVTMHSSKGLEYPIVFCPCLWSRSNRLSQEKYSVVCHDEQGQSLVDLGSDRFAERRAQAVEEELAEELRILYVALTRARLRCYVMWADVAEHRTVAPSLASALGYLLFGGTPMEGEAQQELLQGRAQKPAVEHQLVQPADAVDVYSCPASEEKKTLGARQPSSRSLYTDWQMSSYSAMAALSEYDDHETTARQQSPGSTGEGIPLVGLPAGAHFGNLIHDLLEGIPFGDIAGSHDYSEVRSQACRRYGVKLEDELLQHFLENIVTTPLSCDGGFALAQLEDRRCLKEMEFYFHLNPVTTDQINRLLSHESTVSPLGHKALQGYMTGFVDLICEHQGKFYILDYKTNNLGDYRDDYRREKLVEAMRSHNYGLQYWIYSVILHRHLLNVLEGYSYESHFGGVMYLFVRGMVPQQPGSGVYHALPDKETLVGLDRCLGGSV